MAIARSRAGKTSSMSMSRMRIVSDRPAAKPATAPINVPTTIATPTVTNPMSSEHPAAEDDPRVLVADVAVEPEDVLRLARRTAQEVDARGGPHLGACLVRVEHRLVRVVGPDDVGEDGDEDQEREDREPDDRGSLAQDVAGVSRHRFGAAVRVAVCGCGVGARSSGGRDAAHRSANGPAGRGARS